ncbi:short-chain dehydrogenase [Micromonospora qiuiae]|uniref:Short-chain dehydrogenase n=1 Tax=Micromonospora qiuiae TaxID=502268 RepID=A0ABQ4JJ78_9ACTN|nr:SDR family oxidoreductase [Micromonospora qiuiae]GIJ29520.1 short-chain dehydrogenase [Micromonospora qiuiae]
MEGADKYAVVTGASTGIGRATALRLASDGYRVFATVRQATDGDALRAVAGDRLVPIQMDLTDPDQIAEATGEVLARLAGRGLDVLVNSAGISVFRPIEMVSGEHLRRQFEVNVTGPVAVTQALLPAIRAVRGRLIIIGSVSSRLTMPFSGPYSASKKALLAVTEALRMELAPWGIRVVLVEPGAIRTAASEKLGRDAVVALDEFGPEGRDLYGDGFRKVADRVVADSGKGSAPEVVAEVVSRAARSSRPRLRYPVGRQARTFGLLAKLPAGLLATISLKALGLPTQGGR